MEIIACSLQNIVRCAYYHGEREVNETLAYLSQYYREERDAIRLTDCGLIKQLATDVQLVMYNGFVNKKEFANVAAMFKHHKKSPITNIYLWEKKCWFCYRHSIKQGFVLHKAAICDILTDTPAIFPFTEQAWLQKNRPDLTELPRWTPLGCSIRLT